MGDHRDTAAQTAAQLADRQHIVALEGMTPTGEYDPTDSTTGFFQGDTQSIIPTGNNYDDQPNNHARLPVLTTQIGDATGLSGGETGIAIPTQSGYALLFHHDPINSPNVPSQQRWFTALKRWMFKTLGGVVFDISDISADGDGNPHITFSIGSISFTVDGSYVQLGSYSAVPNQGNAIVRQSDLQAAINALTSEFNSHKHSGVTTGSGVSGTITPTYTAPTATASATSFTE